jgi:hypothetical protein
MTNKKEACYGQTLLKSLCHYVSLPWFQMRNAFRSKPIKVDYFDGKLSFAH